METTLRDIKRDEEGIYEGLDTILVPLPSPPDEEPYEDVFTPFGYREEEDRSFSSEGWSNEQAQEWMETYFAWEWKLLNEAGIFTGFGKFSFNEFDGVLWYVNPAGLHWVFTDDIKFVEWHRVESADR